MPVDPRLFGGAGLAAVVACCVFANWLSWAHPRWIQRTFRRVLGPLQRRHLNPLESRADDTDRDISPFLWPDGTVPRTAEWRALAAGSFADYPLRVTGLVEREIELSLDEMRALGRQDQTTMHHGIQGWSGIAHRGGLPLAKLMEIVRPRPEAGVVVFHSSGPGIYGGEYYDSLTLANARHHQTILASEMNHRPLLPGRGQPLTPAAARVPPQCAGIGIQRGTAALADQPLAARMASSVSRGSRR